MMSSSAFDTIEGDSRANNFLGSTHEFGQDFHHLGPIFTTSPEQLRTPLPDPDPRLICAQLSPIYPYAHKAPPSLTHALFDFYGQPLQADNQSNHYYTRLEPASATQSYTIPNVDPSLKGHTHSVVNDPFPVHETLYYPQADSTYAQPYYGGFQAAVDQRKAHHAAIGTPYQQTQSPFVSMVQSPSTDSPCLLLQPIVCRSILTQVPPTYQNPQGNHSITSSPYHPVRTSSLPVQSASPQEVVLGTCKWMKEDGTVCGSQIASATVPGHLAGHGIKHMTGNCRLQCKWLGCRLRGNQKEMNRENIVRHVREKHLRCKRTL